MNLDVGATQVSGEHEVIVCVRLTTILKRSARAAHIWYRMQGRVVHRGIKTVGREPGWCRLNSEYPKALAPFLIPREGGK